MASSSDCVEEELALEVAPLLLTEANNAAGLVAFNAGLVVVELLAVLWAVGEVVVLAAPFAAGAVSSTALGFAAVFVATGGATTRNLLELK